MPDFLARHKVFRRLSVVWAVAMVSLVVLTYVDTGLGKANAPDGVIITGVIGLFGLALKLLLDRDGK